MITRKIDLNTYVGRRRQLRTLARTAGLVFLVVVVVALGALGVPLPVFIRRQQQTTLRNEYVACEVVHR